MFNISENTKITGAENVRSISHLQHLLYADKTLRPDYSYCGPRVQKGTVIVTTADGPVLVKFDARDGWAREIAIENTEV